MRLYQIHDIGLAARWSRDQQALEASRGNPSPLDLILCYEEQEEAVVEAAARDYTAAKLHAVDSFRGLAHLKVESPRDTGLALFDTKTEALPYLYGYSPYAPELLVPTTILPREDKEEYLAYFFQTSYQGISGAPIVARDGRVVMLSALRHPKNPKRGLAIPPGSLRQFVQASQK